MSKYAIFTTTLIESSISKEYLEPIGLTLNDVKIFKVYKKGKTAGAKEIKQFLDETLPILVKEGVRYILVNDSNYFKSLTGVRSNIDFYLGYVNKCTKGDFHVVYLPNYSTIFYDPVTVRRKIKLSLNALKDHVNGKYIEIGSNNTKSIYYPSTYEEIKEALDKLIKLDKPLTVDIETFSLKFHTAGISSITFCWSQHDGIAFQVDSDDKKENIPVRKLLKNFFRNFKNKTIYHNIAFDVTVLIYQLYMRDITNIKGYIKGQSVLLKNWDDTKLIAYLATNSCAGNSLSLKNLSFEFSGNYALEEIKNITKVDLATRLAYNLNDGLATWYVYNKYYPVMVRDEQLDIYRNLFKPATANIIQMQLTGLPLDMDRVLEVRQILKKDEEDALNKIKLHPNVGNSNFNPNSSIQLQKLLYETLGLPVLDYTKSGKPATGKDNLEALLKHTNDPDTIELLNGLIDYKAVSKILTAFIPSFKEALKGKDGWHYLTGNFNLGGTVSGRLSSSNP